MKNILFVTCGLTIVMTTACSSIAPKGAGYPDSNLRLVNPAPRNLTPPDYSVEGRSPKDDTFLSSQADYHFTMGETLAYEGQSQRAVEEFKSTLVYDPKSVHVRLRLASEYVRLGMMTEAVEQGESAVTQEPENVEARMLLGGLYSGLKMFPQARDQFAEILKKDSGHTEAAVYMGALLAEEKQYPEAIAYFEGLAKNPKFPDPEKAHYYIGRIHVEQGPNFQAAAEKAFNKALSLRPEYPEAVMALAGLMKSSGREKDMEKLLAGYQSKFGPEHDMARLLAQHYLTKEDFDKALDQLEVVDSFERDNLNVKIQIALIQIEQKKYEDAAVRLEDVLQQAPDSDKVRYYLGAVYEEIGRSELAIEHYSKIAPASGYFTEAAVHSAHLHKNAGHASKAVEVIEAAIKQADDQPSLYAFFATLLDEQKSYKKAATMLTGAVEKFPGNTQLRFFLGTMYDRLGNTQETIAQLNKVLEIDKNHIQALNYLAYTYAELGQNLDQAFEFVNRALELQPGDGYIMDTMGWLYFKKGDNESAIKYLEAAYNAKNDEAIIAEHLGDAYLRHQMWQKAQKMYQRAAQLEPDQPHVAKIQQKIANIRNQSEKTRTPASVSP